LRTRGSIAQREVDQIGRQIAGAQVREEIAVKELENHDTQVENAALTDSFLKDKFTNRELYNWMVNEISGLHFQAYKLASNMVAAPSVGGGCRQHQPPVVSM